MSGEKKMVPIWFFIGLILGAYGVVILGAGLYGLTHRPEVVLAHLHADIWWGALLILTGGWATWRFAPWRDKNR